MAGVGTPGFATPQGGLSQEQIFAQQSAQITALQEHMREQANRQDMQAMVQQQREEAPSTTIKKTDGRTNAWQGPPYPALPPGPSGLPYL